MDLKTFFNDSTLSFCIKDKNWKVSYQNSRCISLCGNRIGTKCTDRCRLYGNNLGQGMTFKPKKSIENEMFDILFYSDENEIVTLLNEVDLQNDPLYQEILRYNLTSRELEIIKLRLIGYKNKEIEQSLFISHPTLKTHINNIRKKLPSALVEQIMNCRH